MTLPIGRGPDRAPIMFVGEAYGKYEAQEGKPFVGPAGRVLNELLLKSGINPQDCYFSNIINAQPPENDLSQWYSRGIPNDLVLGGLDSLRQEIERVRPNVIVPLGNWPLYTFYGQKLNKEGLPTGILNYRGYVLEARKLASGTKIIPTMHPSYIMQGGYGHSPLAVFDLQRAKRESVFPEIRRRPRLCIIDPQGAEREALRARLLSEGRRLVVDIEYVGSRLLCIGFAVSADWAVTIRIRSPADLAWCQSLITSGRPLAAQNAMFDLGILDWHYHINAFEHLQFDTMVAAYNLNIEFMKDLGFLGSFYTDIHVWWDVVDWDLIKKGKQSSDLVYPYNCYDNMVTYEAMDAQEGELDLDPKVREAFTFDMAKLYPLWKMAKRGVPLDFKRFDELRTRAKADQDEGQEMLNVLADAIGMGLGRFDFNVKSPLQVPQFCALMGIKLDRRTPKSKTHPQGQLKTDNITLMEAMRTITEPAQRKALEYIVQVREARNLEEKTLDVDWDDDGRARGIYDPVKTGTRRLSCKKFFPTGKGANMQNLPAPGSNRYGKAVRSCFMADTGYEMGYADLKGAEFLIVAQLTQDPMMLKFAEMSINGTGNVHKETAAFIYGGDPAQYVKDSPFYFLGKKMRHSGNYMIGWMELMGRINAEAIETGVFIDAAQTKELIARYLILHPGLQPWWRETESVLRSTGMLRNLFGFPRRFHDKPERCLPSAVAYVPQATVGDCLNMGLLACDQDEELTDYGFELLANIHDAIKFQYPIDLRAQVLPRVHRLLSIPITIPKTQRTLTIPVEIAVGPNWGELEEWKI